MYHAAAVRQSRDQNPSATGCRFGPKRAVGFHRNRLPVWTEIACRKLRNLHIFRSIKKRAAVLLRFAAFARRN